MRTHNSQKPITELWKACYLHSQFHLNLHKPNGFWYGVDGDWQRWCQDNMPEWVGGFTYEVDVTGLKILRLTNMDEIIEFHNRYAKPIKGMEELVDQIQMPCWTEEDQLNLKKFTMSTFHYPDWKKVSKEYDGIEIDPYQNSLRLHLTWYYTWDCASGCVWNTQDLKLIPVGR